MLIWLLIPRLMIDSADDDAAVYLAAAVDDGSSAVDVDLEYDRPPSPLGG